MKYFASRRRTYIVIFFVSLGLMMVCSYRLEINWQDLLQGFPKAFHRFIEAYLPMDLSKLSEQLYQVWITILVSIAGSFVGMVLAFFSALAISSKTSRFRFLAYMVRGLASFMRNIPEAIWAVLLLPMLWYGDFLAFIVLCIISFGFLTRAFSDSIDETNRNCMEALEASGASYWQIILHAVIPETLPALISWTLYSAENNIRSATTVGLLAGSGIGFLMFNYMGGLYIGYQGYQLMTTAILLVIIVVVVSDQISSQIRKRVF